MSLPPPSKHDDVGPTSANDVGPTPRRIDPTSARCRADEQMTSIRRRADANYRYVADVLLTSARRRRVYSADGISISLDFFAQFNHVHDTQNVQMQKTAGKLLLLLPLLDPFNGLFSRTSWVSRYEKDKTSLD